MTHLPSFIIFFLHSLLGSTSCSSRTARAITSETDPLGLFFMATFRTLLYDEIRHQPNFALRLGKVTKPKDSSWILKPKPQQRLLNGDITVSDLDDSDFLPNLRQKGVDMRIGLDIATLTLKKQADTIILVSGDSDFVQAAKLARREGVTFILDLLWQNVSSDLLEHIDRLRSGFYNP